MTSPFVFEFGEQFTATPQPAPTDAALPVPTTPAVLPPSLTTAQLVRDLKTRLRYVEREIKARRLLEKERAQIQRLLKAAKQEKATVHALKRVTG